MNNTEAIRGYSLFRLSLQAKGAEKIGSGIPLQLNHGETIKQPEKPLEISPYAGLRHHSLDVQEKTMKALREQEEPITDPTIIPVLHDVVFVGNDTARRHRRLVEEVKKRHPDKIGYGELGEDILLDHDLITAEIVGEINKKADYLNESAVRIAEQVKTPEAIQLLTDMYNAPIVGVVDECRDVLSSLEAPVPGRLLAAAKGESWDMREREEEDSAEKRFRIRRRRIIALNHLVSFTHDSDAMNALMTAASDDNALVHSTAIENLGYTRDHRAIPALTQRLTPELHLAWDRIGLPTEHGTTFLLVKNALDHIPANQR